MTRYSQQLHGSLEQSIDMYIQIDTMPTSMMWDDRMKTFWLLYMRIEEMIMPSTAARVWTLLKGE